MVPMRGTVLGAYRIESELGSGGMGTVWLAGDGAGARYAVKVVHPHLLESPGFFKRFLREAEVGKAVRHPNVVRTLDCDALGGHHFLVMEYVEGQTLRELLAELETVPEELCRHIGREVAKGLAAIHEAGVVHRDLKPENVLLTPDHEVKIMDLGVARLADEAIRLSQTGAFVGSIHYAAPEQFRKGGEDLDGRVDLHALGLILYELSSGTHPYLADDVPQVLRRVLNDRPRRLGERNPQLSAFFEEVAHTLLAKDREERFGSATELLRVLEKGEESTWWQGRAKAIRSETRRPLRRIRIPRETAVYGREDELGKLREHYERAKAGDGQVVLIEGEAGIGKTRLVDKLIGRLRQDGEDLNFLFGSYPPGGAATAAGAWSTAYRGQFGAEGLEETLEEYLTVTPILIPAFAALLRGEPPPEGKEPLTKDSIQTVFVHATRALARERPTVVLIEDLHFAPDEGRAMFAALALAVPDRRILLVGTARPGIPEDWRANLERLEHTSRVELSRLGPKDLAHLLKDAFQSDRLANELGMRIAEKSDGNPFFVFEIIRGLREGQFITKRPDGTWVTTKVIRDIEIPSSVQDLIQARIADLDEEEQELLEVAACCGYEFDPTLVAEVLDLRPVPALRRLGQLEKSHRLVRSAGRDYAFDHHQVQEALYGGLNDRLREQYHAGIAEALEARHPEPEGAAAVDLCEHLLKGARGEEALRHLDAALDHLEKGYLNDQAVALADRALEREGLLRGTARGEVLLRKAEWLDLHGRRDSQEAALEEAVALAEEDGDPELRSRARRAVGVCHVQQARYEAAREEFEISRDLVLEIGDRRGEARVTGNLGNVFWSLGRSEEAQKHYESALAIAREIGDRRTEGMATGNLGLVFWFFRRYEAAQECFERHLAISRSIGYRQGEGLATGNLGSLLRDLGRSEEAQEHLERWLAISREIGDRQSEGLAIANLGFLCQSLGQHQEAWEHYERALAVAFEVGDRHRVGLAIQGLAYVCGSLGRYEEAREHLERSLAIAREIGDRRSEAKVTGNLGVRLESLGRFEEARERYERALAIAREIGARDGEGICLDNLGTIHARLGALNRAREQLEESLAITREIGARSVEGYALHDLALAARMAGDAGSAMRFCDEALALRREIAYPSGIAETLIVLGSILVAEDRQDEANAPLTEALALGRELQASETIALASALLVRLPGADPAPAVETLEEHEPRLGHRRRMEVRFHLWKATNDPAHLEGAHRLLVQLVDRAPAEFRETMIENVPLHRDIMASWEEHRGNS